MACTAALLSSLVALPDAFGSDTATPLETPETLQLRAAPPTIAQAHARTLAVRFVAQLALSTSSDQAITRLGLLTNAPTDVVDAVVEQFRAGGLLRRRYEAMNATERSRLFNAQVVGSAKLLEFFADEFERDLKEALAAPQSATFAYLASSSERFRSMPLPIASLLLDVLELPALDDQSLREISSVVRGRADELDDLAPRFERWLNATEDTQAAEWRRSFATLMLLKLERPMEPGVIEVALASTDLALQTAALEYLSARPTAFAAHRDAVLRAFRSEQDPTVWNRLFELLKRQDAPGLGEIYERITEQSASYWPGAIQAMFILRGTRAQQTRFASWSGSGAATCDELLRSLSILEQRARLPTTRAAEDLRRLAQSRPAGCQLTMDSQSQIPALASVTGALISELRAKNDLDGVERVLALGILPSAMELERGGYWTKAFRVSERRAQIVDLRIARATRQIPSQLLSTIEALADDRGSDAILRAEALLTLARTDAVHRHEQAFRRALSDTDPILSRTALILIAGTIDGTTGADALLPTLEEVQHVHQQPDLRQDAGELLRRLVAYGEPYAAEYARQASWTSDASDACFALAPAQPLSVPIAIELLNTAATAGQALSTQLRACLGTLADPRHSVASLARYWDQMPVEGNEIHSAFAELLTLWKDGQFAALADAALKVHVVARIVAYAPRLPPTLSSQQLLGDWQSALSMTHQKDAAELAKEKRRRALRALLYAIPVGVILHLAVWAALLTLYPRSRAVQSIVFWNPWVRKILGFGYMDLILLNVPFARRRLFAPFATPFLGDIRGTAEKQLDRIDYYRNSLVRCLAAHDGTVPGRHVELQPIVQALARHRSRVLLLGKSGLGKSSYLRESLAARAARGREVIVYLRADECRNGVEQEIQQRMQEFGSDQHLLKSMIYAGRMYIYIDGYNEVDLQTQDLITGFIANYPHANILVASQIPLRGLTTIATYELQPLDRGQIREFLCSRTAVLAADAPVRGESFVASAAAFLQDIWSHPRDDFEANAFNEILSNPMDLTSVALLLGDGRVPDVFALEAQQFESVQRDMLTQGIPFRIAAFATALYQQRTNDQENLQELPFGPEVIALVEGKLALKRTFGNASATQEVRFRHDRIRDFFTHFAFLDMDTQTRTNLARDARFNGVFSFLARALTDHEADELREALIRMAAEIEDHRVSDSFVREYSWRQRFASQDPEWMLEHDLPKSKLAEAAYSALRMRRQQVEQDMNEARSQLSTARRLTRILATADPLSLLELACELCQSLGACVTGNAFETARAMRTPRGTSFMLVALGQLEAIRPVHIELLLARPRVASETPVVVVTNSRVLTDPTLRPADLDESCARQLASQHVATVSARALYAAFHAGTEAASESLWSGIEAQLGGVAK